MDFKIGCNNQVVQGKHNVALNRLMTIEMLKRSLLRETGME